MTTYNRQRETLATSALDQIADWLSDARCIMQQTQQESIAPESPANAMLAYGIDCALKAERLLSEIRVRAEAASK